MPRAYRYYQEEDKFSPEESVNLTGTGSDPTHHIVLSDGERELGFSITDQQGDRDERTFRRFPLVTPKQPYVTEQQDDFGGGFGQASFEDNRSMYWRSRGVDTTKGALVLAPSFHYAQGTFRKAQGYMEYGDFRWTLLLGVHGWRAMPFTPAQNWASATYLKIFLRKAGIPATLRVRLYTDDSGPNTLFHTQDITQSTITDPDGQWVRLSVPKTYAFAADTKYWVVITTTGGGEGLWLIGTDSSHTDGLKSLNGSSWTNANDFFFRIEGPKDAFTAKFFDYKKQLYTLLTYDAWKASTLWMNGWRGACDSNTGEKNKLKDTTQNWSTRITGDEVVQIIAGPASGELEDQRGVDTGYSQYLTVDDDWIITHNTSDEYVITNSDHWFNLAAGTKLDGRVTDVAVADEIAYICRANNRSVSVFRHHNVSGVWTKEFGLRDVKAQFVRTINDPISGDILWYGYNRRSEGAYKPQVWLSKPVGFYGWEEDVTIFSWGDTAADTWIPSTGDVTISSNGSRQVIKVTVNEVDGVSVYAAGGTNYSVDDVLTLIDATSSGTCTVTVLAIGGGGEVTSVSLTTPGFDYSTGNKATTCPGQSGTGGSENDCLITVNTLGGFGTGQFAYVNLKDADGYAETYDLRFMKRLEFIIEYRMVTPSIETLSAGQVSVQFDNNTGASSPFAELTIPDMQYKGQRVKNIALSLETTDGAQSLTSLGFKLTSSQNYSFEITVWSNWYVYCDKKPIVVGQVDGDNITGLEAFGDPETAWVFTETGFGQLKNQKFLPVPQRELKVARNSNNGRGHEVSDVYLLFTWQGRLQRYYRQNIEDLGPDFPAGMGDIAGQIVDIKTYPGRVYVAVDGGKNSGSMILCHKGGAWHEVFTSFSGERIRNLFIQSIEGKSDKLWASVGSDLMWFPIALDAAELPSNSDYKYTPVGYLDTSWIYTSSKELNKIFRSVLATMDRARDADLDVDVYFKIDDEDNDWIKTRGDKEKSASTLEYLFTKGTAEDVMRGNRLRIRLALTTLDMTKTPTVRSIQNRMYRMPEVKFSYTWLTKLSTISINLRGEEERVAGAYNTIQAAYDIIDEWTSHLTPLSVTTDIGSFSGKLVVLEAVPGQLLVLVHSEKIQEQSIQMAANEL